jgi:large subunit ribosomal protein L4
LYKGGGAVNGPVPHFFGFKINRKVKDLAKMSALAHKAKQSKILVVEDMKLDAPKTKEYANMLDALRGDSRKSMMVIPEYDTNVYLSSRNLPNTKTVLLSDLNTYDITHTDIVVFTETVAKLFTEGLEEFEAANGAETAEA